MTLIMLSRLPEQLILIQIVMVMMAVVLLGFAQPYPLGETVPALQEAALLLKIQPMPVKELLLLVLTAATPTLILL